MDARSQRVDSMTPASSLLVQGATKGISVTLVLPVLDAEKSLTRIVPHADEALARANRGL